MRKLLSSIALLSAIILSSTPSANAQLQKGNLMVGGDILGMSFENMNNSNSFDITLSPKAGYFFKDNMAAGLQANISISSNSGSSSFGYELGAFGRYYVSDKRAILLNHARFFGEVNVGFSGSNINYDNAPDLHTNGIGFGFGPGISYFLTPNIGLEALVKYNYTAGFGNVSNFSKFTFGIGFQIYLPTPNARAMYNDVRTEIKSK